jgi:hypothetical protein
MGGDRWLRTKISVYASGVTLKSNTQSEVAGPTIALYAVIRLVRRQSLPYDRSESKRSPRVNHDHNLDRNGADDDTGAIGIRRRDGSSGSGRHHTWM